MWIDYKVNAGDSEVLQAPEWWIIINSMSEVTNKVLMTKLVRIAKAEIDLRRKWAYVNKIVEQKKEDTDLYNLCYKYVYSKYPLTWQWSLVWNQQVQTDFINQCIKNPKIIEPEIILDNIKENIYDFKTIWLEVSWLNTIWKSWWALILYWKWFVTNNKYFTDEAKLLLNQDLDAVSQELNILGKIKKLKVFTTRLWKEYMNFSFLSRNWIQYRFKNQLVSIQRHIIWNSNYISWKSYFNTSNIDEVIDLHKEAMNKVPLSIFNNNISSFKWVLINMNRTIWTYAERNQPTNYIRIIIQKDWSIHWYPDVIKWADDIVIY